MDHLRAELRRLSPLSMATVHRVARRLGIDPATAERHARAWAWMGLIRVEPDGGRRPAR